MILAHQTRIALRPLVLRSAAPHSIPTGSLILASRNLATTTSATGKKANRRLDITSSRPNANQARAVEASEGLQKHEVGGGLRPIGLGALAEGEGEGRLEARIHTPPATGYYPPFDFEFDNGMFPRPVEDASPYVADIDFKDSPSFIVISPTPAEIKAAKDGANIQCVIRQFSISDGVSLENVVDAGQTLNACLRTMAGGISKIVFDGNTFACERDSSYVSEIVNEGEAPVGDVAQELPVYSLKAWTSSASAFEDFHPSTEEMYEIDLREDPSPQPPSPPKLAGAHMTSFARMFEDTLDYLRTEKLSQIYSAPAIPLEHAALARVASDFDTESLRFFLDERLSGWGSDGWQEWRVRVKAVKNEGSTEYSPLGEDVYTVRCFVFFGGLRPSKIRLGEIEERIDLDLAEGWRLVGDEPFEIKGLSEEMS
ncbi:hypothetical protein IAT38_005094 [Cryptococcus sp. DSM 104549]